MTRISESTKRTGIKTPALGLKYKIILLIYACLTCKVAHTDTCWTLNDLVIPSAQLPA